ncbi:hypothetical protein OIU85_025003 [Salix viminalis]|uniref:Ubiquitin-like domain-containing protein n=1 Tax=Salix viminalis TaxID=40686 RepID=A0A9Q0U1W7_SALVM|nr:hypothetical protein OIU85_025003 [Salix viminalis]
MADSNTVFIDTTLDTHLALIVSASDTVSDLKKKILHEHKLCFPTNGDIKIHALKVKQENTDNLPAQLDESCQLSKQKASVAEQICLDVAGNEELNNSSIVAYKGDCYRKFNVTGQ